MKHTQKNSIWDHSSFEDRSINTLSNMAVTNSPSLEVVLRAYNPSTVNPTNQGTLTLQKILRRNPSGETEETEVHFLKKPDDAFEKENGLNEQDAFVRFSVRSHSTLV